MSSVYSIGSQMYRLPVNWNDESVFRFSAVIYCNPDRCKAAFVTDGNITKIALGLCLAVFTVHGRFPVPSEFRLIIRSTPFSASRLRAIIPAEASFDAFSSEQAITAPSAPLCIRGKVRSGFSTEILGAFPSPLSIKPAYNKWKYRYERLWFFTTACPSRLI